MLAALRAGLENGSLPRLTDQRSCSSTLKQLMNKDWVVYASHCLSKQETVVHYLSRYTRKIALSESRSCQNKTRNKKRVPHHRYLYTRLNNQNPFRESLAAIASKG